MSALTSRKNGQVERKPELETATIRSGSCSSVMLVTPAGPCHSKIDKSRHPSARLKSAKRPAGDATTRRSVALVAEGALGPKSGGSGAALLGVPMERLTWGRGASPSGE